MRTPDPAPEANLPVRDESNPTYNRLLTARGHPIQHGIILGGAKTGKTSYSGRCFGPSRRSSSFLKVVLPRHSRVSPNLSTDHRLIV
jgi:hypothetical protein